MAVCTKHADAHTSSMISGFNSSKRFEWVNRNYLQGGGGGEKLVGDSLYHSYHFRSTL